MVHGHEFHLSQGNKLAERLHVCFSSTMRPLLWTDRNYLLKLGYFYYFQLRTQIDRGYEELWYIMSIEGKRHVTKREKTELL